MTEKIDFQIPVDQRVRLKGEATELYEWAGAGSEGWIRKRKRDPVGYPMVFVEWDRDHWTFNGEQSQWTFEGHFDIVEDNMAVDKNAAREALSQLSQAMGLDEKVDEPEVVEKAEVVEEEPDVVQEKGEGEEHQYASPEDYKKSLNAAAEAAAEGKAFVLVTITEEQVPGVAGECIIPRVFTAHQDSTSEVLIYSTLSELAALTHKDLAMEHVYREKQKDK